MTSSRATAYRRIGFLNSAESVDAPDEENKTMQLIYAAQLDSVTRVSFVFVVGAFAFYVSGIVPPYVPLEQLPYLWGLPVKAYLEATGTRAGWNWVYLLHHGEFLSCLGVAFLSTITIVCYMRILPHTIRLRDHLFAGIIVVEILVLALGALGILATAQ